MANYIRVQFIYQMYTASQFPLVISSRNLNFNFFFLCVVRVRCIFYFLSFCFVFLYCWLSLAMRFKYLKLLRECEGNISFVLSKKPECLLLLVRYEYEKFIKVRFENYKLIKLKCLFLRRGESKRNIKVHWITCMWVCSVCNICNIQYVGVW